MAELRRNVYKQTKDFIIMYIKCAYVGFSLYV
jgi:hypothetical protein